MMIGCAPDNIVPVVSLHPVLPTAEQQRVHFSGKQVEKRVAAYGKGNRAQQISGMRC